MRWHTHFTYIGKQTKQTKNWFILLFGKTAAFVIKMLCFWIRRRVDILWLFEHTKYFFFFIEINRRVSHLFNSSYCRWYTECYHFTVQTDSLVFYVCRWDESANLIYGLADNGAHILDRFKKTYLLNIKYFLFNML